ncbi:MAG TPA: NAD-dependent epimerase/dehydratase family protein [Gammaproteobacteria bacterium]|nr:NAD-dependent epimerase/dehydratase family protein [Gammaproteobacteria bacterium]
MTGAVIMGAGPLGRAIAAEIAEAGGTVRVLTRDGRDIGPGITPVRVDLVDEAAVIAACDGAETIYQSAAPPYQHWADAFPRLQANALTAAARTGAVLVAAENLYGYGVAGVLHEGLPLRATTRKGSLRARLSEDLLAAHAAGTARTVAGRASDFVGPGVTLAALGERFWPHVLIGKPVSWFGDPDARHSFTWLPDFATALIRLADDPEAWGRAWHVPALPALTVRELCDRIAEREGLLPPRIRRTPTLMLRAVGLVVPAAGELVEMGYMFDRDFIVDHAAFDARYGPAERTWDEALAEAVAWWRKEMERRSTG